jgi:hypothetical protein
MSHKTDAKRLKDQLIREGFLVRMTGSGHWEVRTQSGERVTTFPQTPSDRRWRLNAITVIRRWKRSRGIPLRARRLQSSVYQSIPKTGLTRSLSQAERYRKVIAVTVVPGDTLSGIAFSHGVSLSSVEAANQWIADPDLIFPGQKVAIPSGGSFSGWNPAAETSVTVSAGPAPAPVTSPSQVVSAGASGSFQSCVIQRESGGNASAVNASSGAGGLYQFLPSTWASLGYSGLPENASVATQNAAFQAAFAQSGTSPWAPYDGC